MLETVKAFRLDVATQVADPILAAAKIALIDADFAVTFDTVIGDLSISAAAGLVPLAVTAWSDPIVVEGDQVEIVPTNAISFIAGAITEAVTIFGYAITNTAGSTLYAVEHFDSPVAINHPGDGLVVPVAYRYGN